MKKLLLILFIPVLLLIFTTCSKYPQVFSVNNFMTELSNSRKVPNVSLLEIKGLQGNWTGLSTGRWIDTLHRIGINNGSSNDINTYLVHVNYKGADITNTSLEDPMGHDAGYTDTTHYEMIFISVNGQTYAELVSFGKHESENFFKLPLCLSTYAKVNKISSDTIIVQMPNGRVVIPYIEKNNYQHFIPFVSKIDSSFICVYLTEEPTGLAKILGELYTLPHAYQSPDTIVRVHSK